MRTQINARTRNKAFLQILDFVPNKISNSLANNLMEYITLRLDSTNKVEQWYVRHNYFYCLIT